MIILCTDIEYCDYGNTGFETCLIMSHIHIYSFCYPTNWRSGLIRIVLFSNILERYCSPNSINRKDGKHYVLYKTYKMEIK